MGAPRSWHAVSEDGPRKRWHDRLTRVWPFELTSVRTKRSFHGVDGSVPLVGEVIIRPDEHNRVGVKVAGDGIVLTRDVFKEARFGNWIHN